MAASSSEEATTTPKGIWLVRGTMVLLLVDAIGSFLLLSPVLLNNNNNNHDDDDNHISHRYTVAGSLWDLLLLSGCRVVAALVAFVVSYYYYARGGGGGRNNDYYPFVGLYHPNGTKKTRDELEEEALSQSPGIWIRRYVHRASFPTEVVCLCTTIWTVVKCLVRLDTEISSSSSSDEDSVTTHPLVWLSFLFAALVSVVEVWNVDAVCLCLGKWGSERRTEVVVAAAAARRSTNSSSHHLSVPLLSSSDDNDDDDQLESQRRTEEEQLDNDTTTTTTATAAADGGIGVDTDYKAKFSDLLQLCAPDVFLISIAFVFLLLAAVTQIYIPKYTGACLDALEEAFRNNNNNDDDDDNSNSNNNSNIRDIPGFMSNVQKLIVVSALSGLFSGIRGSIFTQVGGRVNVRLRLRLMDSLLTMEQGFFDLTKTGDITSRLSSDTTLVGDQVTLNVNVFLRSLVQVIGVLVFMFMISWQLSLLAFISVPVITILSRWYGTFIRSLTKVMQTKLAQGNSVSEAALSAMPTLRAFDAAPTEYQEFKQYMDQYLDLTFKSAVAYSGYATVSTSLPQLVTALVVFYGGLLVRNGNLSSGELVSFLLYLQSLSDAFASIGYIFSSLTQAVGAADKIFELMHRKRRGMVQSSSSSSSPPQPGPTNDRNNNNNNNNINNNKINNNSIIEKVRTTGLEPNECRGEIQLQNVEMYYPARPNRRILNGMSLSVPPGSIVALVGPSGGGKSSVISLVQNLYQPSSGRVLLDHIDVHEYSPRWLSQNISIVQQEPTLFARSIKRNIMFGLEGTDREPSQEEIERVAKLSNCHDFIRKMPLQYETEVGERGVQLSGGQKQRIAIARALVRKPKILLLDEATSALDAESEHMVQSAIDHMIESARQRQQSSSSSSSSSLEDTDGAGGTGTGGPMSVMIVAHRLSTIRNADIIFVIKDGRVVEQGKHSELLFKNNNNNNNNNNNKEDGAYASLVRRQMNVQKKLDGVVVVEEKEEEDNQ